MATPTNTHTAFATRRLLLVLLTLASAAGVVGFRLLGTSTAVGRRFDFDAIQTELALGGRGLDSSDALLTAILVVSVVLVGGMLIGASLLWGRSDLAAAVVVTLVGSLATTEILKSALHPRSWVTDKLATGYPSGHSTVALALGLSFVLVTPTERKLVVAAGAALYAAAMGSALVYFGWHLPSDVGGGFCVATAWAAGAAQLTSTPLERSIPGRLVVVALVLVVAAAGFALLLRPGLTLTLTSGWKLLEAVLGIMLVAAACCAVFGYAIARR